MVEAMCVAKSPPRGAAQEERLPVGPLVRLLVEDAWRGRDGHVAYLLAGLGGAQFGIRGEVADDGECGFSGHGVPHASIGRQDA